MKDLKTWMEYCEHLNFPAYTADKKLSNLSKKFSWLAGFSVSRMVLFGQKQKSNFHNFLPDLHKNYPDKF